MALKRHCNLDCQALALGESWLHFKISLIEAVKIIHFHLSFTLEYMSCITLCDENGSSVA